MTLKITEEDIENETIDWFKALGYDYSLGQDISPEGVYCERASYGDVILQKRLREALMRINKDVPTEAIEDAIRKVVLPKSPSLIENNRAFHLMLTQGVDVEYRYQGRIKGDKVWLVDFENPDRNDWLVVNQFTIIEGERNRRPDIIVFVNGMPLGLLELKNPLDTQATLKAAHNQIQTYKADIPSLFVCNDLIVLSDGFEARLGTLTGGMEWYLPWRTMDGKTEADSRMPELEVLVHGVFRKDRLLDLIQHFIVFEGEGTEAAKKMAAYHQYHAVNAAINATIRATQPEGDKRIGVVWHTQGAGKSLSMVFYAAKIIRTPEMKNPTLVVLTDRNDLDEQLLGCYSVARDIIPNPEQAEDRDDLRKLLLRASGGVIFTTIQKFVPRSSEADLPRLSDRRNIVFIADEAHRSQYGFKAKLKKRQGSEVYDKVYGFAKYIRDALPNASFIGFTGTPIEFYDKNTMAVFGDVISQYDMKRAVEDGATVPIYYEARLAKIEIDEDQKPTIDPEFEEVTEHEEVFAREKLKSRWARQEALVGARDRLEKVAKDISEHYTARLEVMEGKAMVVCMSRRICVEMYDLLTSLHPDWHADEDDKGQIKVVMTGSATDPLEFKPHVRSKTQQEFIKKRFKDPEDSLRMVIVRDMWLTGFDAPCLHTMYLDKPMRGHGLMQAIARVNRVFKDKPGGLIVDYLGVGAELKKALAQYTRETGQEATIPQEQAVALMIENYEVVCDLFHGIDLEEVRKADTSLLIRWIKVAMNHILEIEEGKKRYLKAVSQLSKAYALSVPHEATLQVRDDLAFFQQVSKAIKKHTISLTTDSREDVESAIKQLVSRAITSDKVIDIYSEAGLDKPEISIFDDKFLQEMKGLPYKNLALETLKKLLNDEIRVMERKYLIQSRSFRGMLEESIVRYQNRAIEAAQVIEELIRLAKQMNEARGRGEELGLSEDEVAFYDALEVNDSAVKVLGDEVLRTIARDLTESLRKTTTIDWTIRESVRARIRVRVKHILREHGYPPDKQEQATKTVLEQAELLCRDWTGV